MWDRYRLQFKGDCTCGLYQICRKVLARDPYEGVNTIFPELPSETAISQDSTRSHTGGDSSSISSPSNRSGNNTFKEHLEWLLGLKKQVGGWVDEWPLGHDV